MDYAGFSEEEAAEAVKYYRERYNVTGIFENQPYPGIKELLEGLKEKGITLAVASSKPDQMVKIVLDHFQLDTYFDVIMGSDINRPKMTKAEVILQVLEKMNCLDEREQVIMVGDRHYDVLGAKEAGLSCIGVTYGYGTKEELLRAGAVKTADNTRELGKTPGSVKGLCKVRPLYREDIYRRYISEKRGCRISHISGIFIHFMRICRA